MIPILVIEDNERNARLTRDILVRAGYQVIQASTGGEGLKIAQEQLPPIILMDIQLPDIDGKEVIKQLKSSSDTSQLKIIALTAQAMLEDKKEIEASGCDAYLSKPYSYKNLLSTIQQLLIERG